MFPARLIAGAFLTSAALSRQGRTDAMFKRAKEEEALSVSFYQESRNDLKTASQDAVTALRELGETRLKMVGESLCRTAERILSEPQLTAALTPAQHEHLVTVRETGRQARTLLSYGQAASPCMLVGVGAFGIANLVKPAAGETFMDWMRQRVEESCAIRFLISEEPCATNLPKPSGGFLGVDCEQLTASFMRNTLSREKMAERKMENAHKNREMTKRAVSSMDKQAQLFSGFAQVANSYREHMERTDRDNGILMRRLTPTRIATGDWSPQLLTWCLDALELLDELSQRPLVTADGGFHIEVRPMLARGRALSKEMSAPQTSDASA
ncbi:hypothetical protein [Magnetofaba australis]|uniref:Uncharacterized protein n=1 Tax=Magnetofaba australis IT-1 TaxID=1434232 RepID=A0A1Y2K6W5_9PROT|nr:hypothetical protein [Magnetofaba australis]OSM05047.1 hypothetical protein MAIT1_03179 [Magnetofaba australis IT-1]